MESRIIVSDPCNITQRIFYYTLGEHCKTQWVVESPYHPVVSDCPKRKKRQKRVRLLAIVRS